MKKLDKNHSAAQISMKAAAVAMLLLSATAQAEDSPFSANVGVTSDYIFRGISQTAHNPALQAGVDYAHSSGLYAGAWASNVSWVVDSGAAATGNPNIELDTYVGFRNTLESEFSYDLGYIRYNYLGSSTPAAGFAKADTDEIYVGAGYKWVSAKYSYSLGDFLTVPGARGTDYIEVNASIPLGESGFTLGAHAGSQTYRGAVATALDAAGLSPSYSDQKISLAKAFEGVTVTLAYSTTNASPFYTFAKGGNWGRGAWALSAVYSF